jgi:hypothetical protein
MKILPFVTLLAFSGSPATVQGQSAVIQFAGTITRLDAGYAIPGISVGDIVSGWGVYDAGTPDAQPLLWIGAYVRAITSFRARIGTNCYTLGRVPTGLASEIDVINDDLVYGIYWDDLYFRVGVTEQSDPATLRFLQLTFADSGTNRPAVLSDDRLSTGFNLNGFGSRSGFITYYPPGASQGCDFSFSFTHLSEVPRLHITESGSSVILSWPAATTNFVLETTGMLDAAAVWNTVTNEPVVTGSDHTVSLSTPTTMTFYRLKLPFEDR